MVRILASRSMARAVYLILLGWERDALCYKKADELSMCSPGGLDPDSIFVHGFLSGHFDVHGFAADRGTDESAPVEPATASYTVSRGKEGRGGARGGAGEGPPFRSRRHYRARER